MLIFHRIYRVHVLLVDLSSIQQEPAFLFNHVVSERSFGSTPANLLLVDFKRVAILHVKRIWIICRLHTLSVEEKAHTLRGLALPIAKRIHQLLQLGSAFDLEKHLVVIIRDFDIEMLRLLSSILGLVHVVWRTVVRHVEGGFGVSNAGSQVCL